jgi:hypothetical protein
MTTDAYNALLIEYDDWRRQRAQLGLDATANDFLEDRAQKRALTRNQRAMQAIADARVIVQQGGQFIGADETTKILDKIEESLTKEDSP